MTNDKSHFGDTAGKADERTAFIERVSAALRAPEHVSGRFDERVMSAVRETQPELQTEPELIVHPGGARSTWWRRPNIQLSPVSALALAAGIAAVAFLGGDSRARSAPVTAPAAAVGQPSDTVHVVRFVFMDADAGRVTIAGSFNGWATESLPLVRASAGVWTVAVPLPAGRHEYAFIVDGERWAADPSAFSITDEFGTATSIVTIGEQDTSS